LLSIMGKGGKAKGKGSSVNGKGSGVNGKGSSANVKSAAWVTEDSPQEKKQVRKVGKRAAQLAKMDEKAQAEADYFWDCKARSQRAGKSGAMQIESRAELFSNQCTFAIDFAAYDAVEVTRSGPGAQSAKVLESFQDLGSNIPEFLSTNLSLMHYSVPTPIQKHALPLALKGNDLMCCAQTGSGKTAAFLLPVVASLSGSGRPACRSDGPDDPALPRCVIMAPTRELIQQIHLEAQKCCYNSGGLRAVVIYGGTNARQQLAELASGCDIAVATPGRLTDFVDRGLVELRMVKHLVLDEADRMLDMGFEPQIRQLVQKRDMPDERNRRTLMFSATFPTEIQKLAKEFLRPYVFIAVGRVGGTTENIEQRLVWASAEKRQKFDLLLEELHRVPGKTLVFVSKKRVATQIKKWLKAEGELAEDIHGDRSQSQREAALSAFRMGECRILCATDVAARGLDIPKVEHVINFDLPTSAEEFDAYVHRIGRTGRAGNTGISTSFYIPGLVPKVGNAGIARDLVKLFKETKNDIPDWFWQLPEAAALGTQNGKPGGNARVTGDIRGDREVVKTRTTTKHRQSAEPAPSSSLSTLAPPPFKNSVTVLAEAAQKQNFMVYYEECADNGGFWCEATVYNHNDSDKTMCKGDASSKSKKDAKHDAAKACVAALSRVSNDSNGGTGSRHGTDKVRGNRNQRSDINGQKDQNTSIAWERDAWQSGDASSAQWRDSSGDGQSASGNRKWEAWQSSDAASGQWDSTSGRGGGHRLGRNGLPRNGARIAP